MLIERQTLQHARRHGGQGGRGNRTMHNINEMLTERQAEREGGRRRERQPVEKKPKMAIDK